MLFYIWPDAVFVFLCYVSSISVEIRSFIWQYLLVLIWTWPAEMQDKFEEESVFVVCFSDTISMSTDFNHGDQNIYMCAYPCAPILCPCSQLVHACYSQVKMFSLWFCCTCSLKLFTVNYFCAFRHLGLVYIIADQKLSLKYHHKIYLVNVPVMHMV